MRANAHAPSPPPRAQARAAGSDEQSEALIPAGNSTRLALWREPGFDAPLALYSYCCGDSTFVAQFFAKYIVTPKFHRKTLPSQQELLASSQHGIDKALSKMGISGWNGGRADFANGAYKALATAIKQRGASFVWTLDYNLGLTAAEAKVIKDMGTRTGLAVRNPLDTMLCQIRDCMLSQFLGLSEQHAIPVTPDGKRSSLCFDRRSSNTPVVVKINDFSKVWSYLRNDTKRQEHMVQALKKNGMSPWSNSIVEDLEAFEYESSPGPLTSKSAQQWVSFANGLGISVTEQEVRSMMKKVMKKAGHKAREDEPYSWRLYDGGGDANYRKQVEALVNEFGYRRGGRQGSLIDWSNTAKTMDGNRHGLTPQNQQYKKSSLHGNDY